jgi:DNA invertase Pin-like site-specific DNA recombinase
VPRLPAFEPLIGVNRSPHVVILGAGASKASFPNGDANGNRLPLLADLPDCLDLCAALNSAGFSANVDFESTCDEIATSGRHPSLKTEIESRARGYFESLILPETPTLYDYLLLSLRANDLIAGQYVDEGFSGAKEKRPALDRLMADAHKRRFDVVAVWKFDRFARSVSHLLRALDTFRVLGIEFVSLSESLDTATPAGRMVFTVLGAVAELERSLIAERVRAGLRNARAKGQRLGRPPVIVDAAKIGRLHGQGRSVREIASELGYSRSLVHKTLAIGGALRVANAAN